MLTNGSGTNSTCLDSTRSTLSSRAFPKRRTTKKH